MTWIESANGVVRRRHCAIDGIYPIWPVVAISEVN
jgi:hypothetical protein